MRRQLRSLRPAIIAGLFGLLALTMSAHATVVVRLTRAQLTQRSDLVVRASVLSQSTAWNAEHTQLVTLTQLAVQSYVKGAGAAVLTLRQFGGTLNGLNELVPGDGELAVGQDVILFLRSGDGVVFLTALAQSVFYVESPNGTTLVRRDISNLTFAAWDATGHMFLSGPPNEIPEPIEHFIADVRALAGGAR